MGLRACGPRAHVCACTWMRRRIKVVHCEHACVFRAINLQVFLTHLAEGRTISLQFIGSHSCALRGADRHLHTYLYNGLRVAVDPCHPHHPFLAAVSLALLSLPPTPPSCASLPLPRLSCFKTSSFPLSVILPISPLPSVHSPLSPCVCKNEWQVSPTDAKM